MCPCCPNISLTLVLTSCYRPIDFFLLSPSPFSSFSVWHCLHLICNLPVSYRCMFALLLSISQKPLSLDKFGDPLHSFPGLTASVCNLRPTSRGSVTLTGPSTFSKPHIDPNYLDTPEDRKIAAESLKLTRKIVLESDAYARYTPEEYVGR